jgi:DNA helicase-2/ATP-dependent DNA helicase PcrA
VGDPNQAIFETFTTASPELLRTFIQNNPSVDMPESGRSQPSILALANHLIDWVMTSHPILEARTALSLPHIIAVPEGHEQSNPPDDPAAIRFISRRYTPEEEMEAVVRSVKNYIDSFAQAPIEEQPTIAILVPRNTRGVEVVNALRQRAIEPIELISSTTETRAAAGSLNYLLSYLADPESASKLARAYQVWRRDVFGSNKVVGAERRSSQNGGQGEDENRPYISQIPALLRKMVDVENFIAPRKDYDWLAAIGESEAQQVVQELSTFRVNVQRWLNAVTLPIDQLVLTLAQDVFTEAPDLALAHKLALVLRQAADDHPDWRLPELTAELAVIAKNERRFIGFSADDSGFDPERHRGRVVVTTMHKAKGLEWDRVYLMSVNNYDFPSNMPNDRFISERWFVRSGLNLEAEALAQLTALESTSEYDWYEEGAGTLRSRLDYVKERLRLFYVGITRAKRELIVTWNSGRQGDATPSLALSELMGWWENQG